MGVHSQVGGGALPEQNLASWAVALQPQAMKISRLEKNLRSATVPVMGRVEQDRLLLDMRTIAAQEEEALFASIGQALHGSL